MARESKKNLQERYEKYRISAMNYKFQGVHAERFSIRGIPELNPSWTIQQLKEKIKLITPAMVSSMNSPYIVYQEKISFRGRRGRVIERETQPITIPQLRNLVIEIEKANVVRRKEGVEELGKPVIINGKRVITEPFSGFAPYEQVVKAVREAGNKEKIEKKKKQFVENFRQSLTTSLQYVGYVDLDNEEEFIQYYLVNVLREYVSRTNWRYIYQELYRARNSGINFSEIFGSDQVILGSMDNIEQLYNIFTKYNAPSYDLVKKELGELYNLIQNNSSSERRKELESKYTKYTKRSNEGIAISHYLLRTGKVR